ncbi:MAG: hypothetical protein K2L49_06115, partial [Muribaculaceae bacterium]|nr:hypothetical protein [Muribaculaceae bacterium]
TTPTVGYTDFAVVGDSKSVDKYNIGFKLTIDVSTGFFSNQISVKIVSNGQTAILHSIVAPVEFISAGDKSTITFNGEFPAGEVGKTYQGYLFVGDLQISVAPVSFTIGERTGIADVEAADDQPAEYFNLQGMPVGADNLRRGQIYIRRQGSTVTKIMY